MQFGRSKARLFFPNSGPERPVAADVASARQFNWIDFQGTSLTKIGSADSPPAVTLMASRNTKATPNPVTIPEAIARRTWRRANILCFSSRLIHPGAPCLELPETRTCINSRVLRRLIANRCFSLQTRERRVLIARDCSLSDVRPIIMHGLQRGPSTSQAYSIAS
jgi:hypothetical protein